MARSWLWRMTDHHDGRFWLYVDRPGSSTEVEVGIEEIYRKYLTPEQAEAMADALRTAAKKVRANKAAERAARDERRRLKALCEGELGGHAWGDWLAGEFACRRCGSEPETQAAFFLVPPRTPEATK